MQAAGGFNLTEGSLPLVLSPLSRSPLSQDISEALLHRARDAERFGNLPLRGLQHQHHGCPRSAASASPLHARRSQSLEQALSSLPLLLVKSVAVERTGHFQMEAEGIVTDSGGYLKALGSLLHSLACSWAALLACPSNPLWVFFRCRQAGPFQSKGPAGPAFLFGSKELGFG